jgi:hypothetical protein
MDRDREVLAKRLDGERATREELQGELSKLQRQVQSLENVEEMLFKERTQRQRAERSIVELARSLGTLKAALLHAGVPIPPEARPSSALQNTVQVIQSACQLAYSIEVHPVSNFVPPPTASRTASRYLLGSKKTSSRGVAAATTRRSNIAHGTVSRVALIRAPGFLFSHRKCFRCAQTRPQQG